MVILIRSCSINNIYAARCQSRSVATILRHVVFCVYPYKKIEDFPHLGYNNGNKGGMIHKKKHEILCIARVIAY